MSHNAEPRPLSWWVNRAHAAKALADAFSRAAHDLNSNTECGLPMIQSLVDARAAADEFNAEYRDADVPAPSDLAHFNLDPDDKPAPATREPREPWAPGERPDKPEQS